MVLNPLMNQGVISSIGNIPPVIPFSVEYFPNDFSGLDQGVTAIVPTEGGMPPSRRCGIRELQLPPPVAPSKKLKTSEI